MKKRGDIIHQDRKEGWAGEVSATGCDLVCMTQDFNRLLIITSVSFMMGYRYSLVLVDNSSRAINTDTISRAGLQLAARLE